MPKTQSKVVVVLNNEEHALLKQLAAQSRRTMGQELAFRALVQTRRVSAATDSAGRRSTPRKRKDGRAA